MKTELKEMWSRIEKVCYTERDQDVLLEIMYNEKINGFLLNKKEDLYKKQVVLIVNEEENYKNYINELKKKERHFIIRLEIGITILVTVYKDRIVFKSFDRRTF